MKSAHRVAYEDRIGPIPKGLVLDHLCRDPLCVNPFHLEPVTLKVNNRRGLGPIIASRLQTARNRARTHCKHGHPFTPENTYRERDGRRCRRCAARRRSEWRLRTRSRNPAEAASLESDDRCFDGAGYSGNLPALAMPAIVNQREESMKISVTSGAAIAAAAAALFVAGAASGPLRAEEAKIHCMGVNACKGQSACKTATSSCNGLNACKGQGFLEMTEAECIKAGGKKQES
jgi:hypothetical protein